MNILEPLAVQLAIFVAGFVVGWFWYTVRDLINKKGNKKIDDKKIWPPGSGYQSEALDISSKLISKLQQLVDEIALNKAKGEGRPWANEDDMRCAFRTAFSEAKQHLDTGVNCAHSRAEDCLDYLIQKQNAA